MSSHKAITLAAAGQPLEIKSRPTPTPSGDEVLIRVKAVATNPVDYYIQDIGLFMKSWPATFGEDLSGEVVEVGPSSSLKKGQRVLGAPTYIASGNYDYAGFQELVLLPEVAVTPIPDSVSYADAAVLPLSVATSAAGLYQDDSLNLPLPQVDPKPNDKKILVWGAASSVGSSAVQLAAASGFEVIATASKKNFDYVQGLVKGIPGSKIKVFDYTSPSVVGDITAELGENSVGAYDAIATQETQLAVGTVIAQLGGGKVASVLDVIEGLPATVNAKRVFAPSIFFDPNEKVGQAVFGQYLPRALEKGQFVPNPKPDVIGHGLEKIQEGLDLHKKGVSAKKIVITL